jgi:hypothetical protein
MRLRLNVAMPRPAPQRFLYDRKRLTDLSLLRLGESKGLLPILLQTQPGSDLPLKIGNEMIVKQPFHPADQIQQEE